MKIAVLSDTHGRVAPVERAGLILAKHDIGRVLHCGDVDDAALVGHLPRGTEFVWGNCDSDRAGIAAAVDAIGGVHHGDWGNLELGEVKVAFTHSHDINLFRQLEQSDAFDFLFYGHTHVAKEHRTGRTRVINPGALHRAARKTFVILDTSTGEVESFDVT
jgi:putative phosphoesterase